VDGSPDSSPSFKDKYYPQITQIKGYVDLNQKLETTNQKLKSNSSTDYTDYTDDINDSFSNASSNLKREPLYLCGLVC